jgi:hypothetical protein
VSRVQVRYRAEGEAEWRSAAMQSDAPCYSAVLARLGQPPGRASYLVEAQGFSGEASRTQLFEVAVAADLSACGARTASAQAAPRPATASPAPQPQRLPAEPARPAASPAPSTGGGGRGRSVLLVAGGAAVVGGGVVAATRSGGAPATTLATGLPAGGIGGVYVGSETVNYGAGCSGVDDIVLNLRESGGSVSGVLSFTVRTCPCCAAGRGANPVSGTLSGERLRLETPVGFVYTGTFAGSRLSGELSAPGGVSGSFNVERR